MILSGQISTQIDKAGKCIQNKNSMKKHVKNYINHFKLGVDDNWQCEACAKVDRLVNFDIHHIENRNGKNDNVENLICLCRKCHEKAHSSKNYVSKSDFQYMHNSFLTGKRTAFLK